MHPNLPFSKLYEDEDFLVINKPAGILTQSDSNNNPHNLLQIVQDLYSETLYLIHRLDRPVSGILILAKNKNAAGYYGRLIKEGQILKSYLAIVQNMPNKENGLLENWLIHDKRRMMAYVVEPKSKNAKLSKLSYAVFGKTDRYSGLLIKLHTGRFHQIRAQLSAIGCPIKGDVKYGARRSNKDRSIHLHAFSLEFKLPDQKRMIKVQAKPPKEILWDVLGEINPLILQDKIEIWKIKE